MDNRIKSTTAALLSAVNTYTPSFVPSNETIGFEKAQRLLILGSGCLIIVFIFGIILCRMDMAAGKRRREQLDYQQVETK